MLTRRSFQSLRCIAATIVIVFLIGCFLAIGRITKEESKQDEQFKVHQAALKDSLKIQQQAIELKDKLKAFEEARIDRKHDQHMDNNNIIFPIPKLENKLPPVPGIKPLPDAKLNKFNISAVPLPNYNVHIFYYPWYGNPKFDGRYVHWNHDRLKHWDKKIASKFSTEGHVPPDDVGASFYPALGSYSSRDPYVIDQHMQQMRIAGTGVLVLSWYPPNKYDDAGLPSDDLVPLLLNACHKYDLKLAFHSEPYKNRTELTFLNDLRYIVDTYGNHPALYKYHHKGVDLPLVYLYDSYLTSPRAWARILKKNTPMSIRNTNYDAVIIGLFVEQKHNTELFTGGFDGFYTYFASNLFTFGSHWNNWKFLSTTAKRNSMIFIPSVGPGYDDVAVRPWNAKNTQERRNGEYYKNAFTAAMNYSPPIISITSFNEWHEGTQIESAVPKHTGKVKYLDYRPNKSNYYLDLTRQLVDKFSGWKR
ncbi:glycoprotein endo-alpha-1,2-mannosidase-like [Asterias rubens]|uniref:glycoprotein endo-alpha-1,2-mannosidase-like n=1 Tax=Asterias rubens TaxID=7604 RepID=UPI001455AD68|nr:glycoprotein endo-alpha-1,2-mannosidase-like [Asterias rubens]